MAHGPSCIHGILNLPGPGVEPVSPALAGGFSSAAPPGKSLPHHLNFYLFTYLVIYGCAGSSLLCAGFSLRWLLSLQSTCSRALRLQSMWHVDTVVSALGSRAQAQVVMAHGLSCSEGHGLFLDQGSYPCLLNLQVDFLPLSHQGSSLLIIFNVSIVFLGMDGPSCFYSNPSHQML